MFKMATKTKKSKSYENSMEKPVWLKYTEDEVKGIIIKLANKGMTSEKIGLTLRDQYGIPKIKLYGFKIKQILKEKGLYEDPNIKNLTSKIRNVEGHYKTNKGDKRAERSLIISKALLKKRKEYQEKKKE